MSRYRSVTKFPLTQKPGLGFELAECLAKYSFDGEDRSVAEW